MAGWWLREHEHVTLSDLQQYAPRMRHRRPPTAERLASGRRAAAASAILTVLLAMSGCSVVDPAPHAPVSSAQRAAVTRYYRTKLWLPDGYARMACPIDVLAAARFGRRLRVYTVVHCTSFSRECAGGTDYTSGLVADLIGTKVVRAQQDDAEGYSGMIAEASIYPTSVRSAALSDINSGGPDWLRELAAKTAGCPDGAR